MFSNGKEESATGCFASACSSSCVGGNGNCSSSSGLFSGSSSISSFSNSSSSENISGEDDLNLFTFFTNKNEAYDENSSVHLPTCVCTSSFRVVPSRNEMPRCQNPKLHNTRDHGNRRAISSLGTPDPKSYLKCSKHVSMSAAADFTSLRKTTLSDEDELLTRSRRPSISCKNGILLKSLEKQALFPLVHFSSRCHDNLLQGVWKYTSSRQVFTQAIYKEVQRVTPSNAYLHSNCVSDTPELSTWLLIGYKSFAPTIDSILESKWKEWTGARQIYLNLRTDLDVRKIIFYTRQHPRIDTSSFTYLVLMKIGNVTEKNSLYLLNFIQRVRIERMKGVFTLYYEYDNAEESEGCLHPDGQFCKCHCCSSTLPPTLDPDGEDLNEDLKLIDKLLQEISQPIS